MSTYYIKSTNHLTQLIIYFFYSNIKIIIITKINDNSSNYDSTANDSAQKELQANLLISTIKF